MAEKTPLAFLSYAHSDDEHEKGKLRNFAERLSGEVHLQSGEEFPIFVDRADLKWGHEWKARIVQSLDAVTFLIPIVTPAYLKSEWCRKELTGFLRRERDLERADLILPVYYVKSPALEDEAKRASDDLAQVLHERQYHDWRRFRHEPWTTPEVARQFEQMALQIVESLDRAGMPPPKVVTKPPAISKSGNARITEPPAERRSVQTEPPTVTVDALHRGKYTSIAEAIRNEPPGTRILVRPGHYREGLAIDKAMEVVGEGNRDDVVIEATGKNVVLFTASMGRMANLTLRQIGTDNWSGIDIAQGRLDLEECDISSGGGVAIAVHGGAEPRVRRNRIHSGKSAGILVYENAAGLIEDNEIFGNALAGIEIKDGANPTIRRNRIHDGKTGGLLVHTKGAGLIEENEIFGNTLAGIEIRDGSNPTIRRNRIHGCKESGLLIQEGGAGLIEDNDILSNVYSGVAVRAQGDPTVRENRIRGNREGIRVYDGGRGTYEKNTLSENKAGPWLVTTDCEPNIKRSGNIES